MPVHIALLRAVNLPKHGQVSMADLRDLLVRLTFTEPRSLLQSGNLVFRSGPISRAQLEGVLEAAAKKSLGLETDFIVRTAAEWNEVVAANPFRHEAESDPSHLVVMALRAKADPARVEALRAAIRGREVVGAHGKQLYIVYPDGIGRSRLTVALIEKKLGTRGTGRNWNTALKLSAAAAELSR
ncbi:MAG TPA: DUF1697 domain-containing protein [Gemmatimonadales bacterium]|nr:DUF1697 domain-containing protein [Gemmatimonadales bacterium]